MIPCGHNPTRELLGKQYTNNMCRMCWLYDNNIEYARRWGCKALQVIMTSDGIGDALLGLCAVNGLMVSNPQAIVNYSLIGAKRTGASWLNQWIELFLPKEVITNNILNDVPACYPYDGYDAQNQSRLAKPRWQWYADNCKCSPSLPPLRDISITTRKWAERWKNSIVLSPFSAWAPRQWLLSHWLLLERLLIEQGESVVILDGRFPNRDRSKKFKGDVLFDESAERVAALLSVADAFVGNDSGMSHLAGLIGTPSVVLCGPIRGEKVFGIYPNVKSINGPLDCAGCHWQGQHGWARHCDAICANLQSINPEQVFQAIKECVIMVKKTLKSTSLRGQPLEERGITAPTNLAKPGAELTTLLNSLGLHAKVGCKCKERAAQMDTWGVEECSRRRDEIVGWIREAYSNVGWAERFRAAAGVLTSGMLTSVNWSDPFGWIVDEAIRRASVK